MLENSKCVKNVELATNITGMLIMYSNKIFKRTKDEQAEFPPVCFET